MKFSYTALGTDNQKLTGHLEAESLESAQAKLHKMDLSIIALTEVKLANNTASNEPVNSEKEAASDIPSTGINTYYFQGNDRQGKEINGTIDSRDPYTAYKRLITEYQFRVDELKEHDAPDASQASLKFNFETWNQQLAQEGITLKQTQPVKETETQGIAQEIVTEIDHFILNTKTILEECAGQYTPRALSAIQKKLDNLERIRTSNNLKHITKVCNDLYDLVAHPDKALDQANIEQAQATYNQTIHQLKESGFVRSGLTSPSANSRGQVAGFEKIRQAFSNIQNTLIPQKIPTSIKKAQIKNSPTSSDKAVGLLDLIKAYGHYLFERNPILRRTRLHDFNQLKQRYQSTRGTQKNTDPAGFRNLNAKRLDSTRIIKEVNSFVGWLLFFYIAFFSFSVFH